MFLLAKCDPTLYPLMLQKVLSLLIIFINHIGIRHTLFLNKHFLTTSAAEPLSVCWLALRIYSSVNYLFCTWFIFLLFFVVAVIFLSICKSSFYSKVVDLSYVWWIFPSIIYYRIWLWYILPWKYFSKYLCSYMSIGFLLFVCFYALFSAEIFVFVT